MKNPYALLNYDMDNNLPTPEFEQDTKFIDGVLQELVNAIVRVNGQLDIDEIANCFYGNLHYFSLGENRKCGDSQVDVLIANAVQQIKEHAKNVSPKSGIGDTETDECIALSLERRLKNNIVNV